MICITFSTVDDCSFFLLFFFSPNLPTDFPSITRISIFRFLFLVILHYHIILSYYTIVSQYHITSYFIHLIFPLLDHYTALSLPYHYRSAVRKINELVKRVRICKVHAYIISHLKEQMPMMMGFSKKQKEV